MTRTTTRRVIAALLAGVVAASGCQAASPDAATPTRVLFVGNSLSYTHNLPATLSALAGANGHPVAARMLARGGATMQQHVEAGLAESALRAGAVDVLVLQEQGGALLCFGTTDCAAPTRAHARLAASARAAHARSILLGTYQSDPRASRAIEAAEAEVARDAGMDARVAVSALFLHARRADPAGAWLDSDGTHPGADLTMLMAIRLYHAMYGQWPRADAVLVGGTDYGRNPHFDTWRIREEPDPASPGRRLFGSDRMRALIALARQ